MNINRIFSNGNGKPAPPPTVIEVRGRKFPVPAHNPDLDEEKARELMHVRMWALTVLSLYAANHPVIDSILSVVSPSYVWPDGKKVHLYPPEVERLFCPQCQTLGMKSSVFVTPIAKQGTGAMRFYDEDGKLHVHDPAINAIGYNCTQGHTWQKNWADNCWCGWPNQK